MSISLILDEQKEHADAIKKAYDKLIAEEATVVRIETRLRALNVRYNRYQDNHASLWKTKYTGKPETRTQLSESPYFKNQEYLQIEEIYLTTLEKMQTLKESLDRTEGRRPTETADLNFSVGPNVTQHVPGIKLNKMDVPYFDGDFSTWIKFRDEFNQFVGLNTSLTSVQKLYYLKKHLQGNAELRMRNLLMSSDNFQAAWDSLIEYYDNTRLLVNMSLSILFNATPAVKNSLSSLDSLYSQITQAITSLQALERPVDKWDDILVYLVTKKLDSESIREWERVLGAKAEPPTWSDMKTFILTRIRTLQSYQADYAGSSESVSAAKSKFSGGNQRSHLVNSQDQHAESKSAPFCACCKGEHYLDKCERYERMSVEQRVDLIKRHKLCFNCLGFHFVDQCESRKCCRTCKGRHHTSIHYSRGSATSAPASTPHLVDSGGGGATGPTALTIASGGNPRFFSTILATALVRIKSHTGELIEERALVDPGSQVTLINEHLAQRLRLPRRYCSHSVSRVGAARSQTSRGIVDIDLFSRWDEYVCSSEAIILPHLTDYVPQVQSSTCISVIEGLPLADPDYGGARGIGIILGIDVYHLIIQPGLRKTSNDQPIAQETSFGWILSGKITSDSNQSNVSSFHVTVDTELNDLVKSFWIQEEIFTECSEEMSSGDAKSAEYYSYTRAINGQYIVRLPFKSSPSQLGHSRGFALKMLNRLIYRFKQNPDLYQQYKKFMDEYEKLGHMSQVSPGRIKYYFPHHPVFRESSLTTKIRVVFNGSSKTSSGVSLNDILHEGPNLLAEIFVIITRWRIYRYVYTADVEKMFRQILVHPDDRCYQGILWLDDQLGVVEWELNTVTYGSRPAPCLANQTVRQLAHDEGDKYPEAKRVLEESTYMDDIYGGEDTIEKCRSQIHQVIQLCRAGGFPLQKWATNHPNLLESIGPGSNSSVHLIDDQNCHRTLGLLWDTVHDEFRYSTKVPASNEKLTKRIVLSRVAQLFDPLGWIAPFVVRGKLIIQSLWQSERGWDEEITEECQKTWQRFFEEIQDLSNIRVPRFLQVGDYSKVGELHGFSDASGAAYGTAIYLRTLDAGGNAHVNLISSKSKLAPVSAKKSNIRITIPRLELMAASLLVRHVKMVLRALSFDNLPINLWTDSAVSLYWIRSENANYKQFVQNRVREIQSSLPQAVWRHVPGTDNPADLVSRGVSGKKLAESTVWWTGPSWLTQSESQWPKLEPSTVDPDSLELKKAVTHVIDVNTQSSWDLLDKFSSLKTLLAVTAWCQRIFRVARKKIELTGSASTTSENYEERTPSQFEKAILLPIEIEDARLFWVREVQRVNFAEDIKSLRTSGVVARKSPLFRLVPFVDGNGILRLTGRLQKSLLEDEFKHPAILPSKSKLTELLLHHVHQMTLHGGVRVMLTTLRRNYWIIGGRRPVTAFVHRCVRCTRFRAVTARQLMGQLPLRRITRARPFLHSGVDYAGPFSVLTWRGRGAKCYKAFIVVFVCFITSGVHLELASDYSSEGFLACYRRFTARRGICQTLTSDCGTNLVGADRELRRLFNSASKESQYIAHLLGKNGTQWIFNPPGSPHHGGKWEAAVRSMKFHVKRVIGDSTLTYEEFSTLLTQVEAILNSRPLCDKPDDPDEFAALTPGDFISGGPTTIVPGPSLTHLPTSRLSRYQHIQQMIEYLWERWSSEYIHSLQEINKWHRPSTNLQVGALVLLVDERLPPTKWALARIEKLHLGADGLCRVVTVRTAVSTFTRSIVKICPLPVEIAPAQPDEESPDKDEPTAS